MTESITTLIDAKILGFLVYDEERRLLKGQIPFIGLSDSTIGMYQAKIEPGSRGEQIWNDAEVIISTKAPEDERLQALELHHLALAAGIHHTVLVPLCSGAQIWGYMQVANKSDDSPFDKNDVRLLSIIAGQAAPIIENATLVQVARQRAQRAETLRRIASLTSSSATRDEILKFSILDLARLLGSDASALYLFDENRGELQVHTESIFGIAPQAFKQFACIAVDEAQFQLTVTARVEAFFSNDLRAEPDTPPLYQSLGETLDVRSMIIVPLVTRERGIGELIVASFKEQFFSHGDVQTVATSAGQLAAAIEQAALYSQTDQSLRTRVDQLTALSRISRELNTTVDRKHLLQRVYDEALKITRANCGTILVFDLDQAGGSAPGNGSSPGPPKIALRLGEDKCLNGKSARAGVISLEPEFANERLHPLERLVLESTEPLIIDEFTSPSIDEVGHIETPAHGDIRSAMIVPIAYKGQVTGMIHLHSREAKHFGEAEREFGEALATQAAIALGNAQRYRDQLSRSELLNRRVETLSSLFEIAHVLQQEGSLENSLESVAYAIQSSTSFEYVLISVYDKDKDCLRRVSGAGVPLDTMELLKTQPQPWEVVEELLIKEYQSGGCYFIPHEKMPVPPAELHVVTLLPESSEAFSENKWHPDDLLFVPLFDAHGEPLGTISVDAPRDNLRPDRPTIETLDIFGTQASLLIESRSKLAHLRERLDDIEVELQLAIESATQARSHLPVLLHKDLEQSLAIQQLSQRSRRINAGLDIATLVGRQRTRPDVLLTLGQEMLARMDFDVILIAEDTGDLRLNQSLGHIPGGVNPKALLGQRNPLRQCLSTGETMLVSNLIDESSEWQNTPLLRALEAESFICIPIGKIPPERSQSTPQLPPIALLGTSCSTQAPFTQDDEQLYSLLARQVTIALQNLSLLDETTRRLNEVDLLLDFSRQLGSLDASNILLTLVESVLNVVSSAEGAMATIWDDTKGLLVPKAASGYSNPSGLMDVNYQQGEGLPGQVFEDRQALCLDEVDFAKHYNLSPDNLMQYRNALGGILPVSSMAVPITASIAPQQSGDNGNLSTDGESLRSLPLGVLVVDNTKQTAAFSADDLALITSLAHQTALTLENARLYQAAEQRSQQLQALTEVSTTITSSLKSEDLIAALLEQLQEILPYDTGILWLQEEIQTPSGWSKSKDKMVVRAARGFDDSDQRVGLAVDVDDSDLLKVMIDTSQPIWVPNIRNDPRFLAVSFEHNLDDTRPTIPDGYSRLSWLGVPLIASGQVFGVIALEKREANFYTTDDIQVATTFAGQAAVGLENAQLYQESVQRAKELDKRSRTLTILNRLSSELSGSLNADHIIESSLREFYAVIPSNHITALRFSSHRPDDTGTGGRQVMLQAEYPPPENDASQYNVGSLLPDIPLFQRLSETLGIYNSANISEESELAALSEFLIERHTHSLLVIPIASGFAVENEGTSENLMHGLLLAHNQESYRYDSEEMELARTISNQIAISLQNARLFEETRSLTEDLELRVQERTAELEKEHLRAETLLRIIKELSASLDLDQVLHSTLEVLSDFVDAGHITVLIARPGTPMLQRLASIGYTREPSKEGKSTPFRIDQGLAGWIITQRQPVLIKDVLEDERWIEIKYHKPREQSWPKHRSALGVPLMSGADALGALMLFHHKVDHFSIDHLDLVQAAANQVAISVNNAELYKLIRDQAEDLGTMLRSQQIETSRSKAILEAVADGVLVTDENRQITLFNESAETILGLERLQVVGKSMEHFSGLFGRAAQSWMEIIRTWSQDPSTDELGDTHAEQIMLEDGRVISVHLAPVSLQKDFLGTVSIFQDVTHQVEVDRLKSEFVGTVSHELRTPMTSIKGYVEVLLMGAGGQLNEKQTNFLQVVKTNAERLSVLVNDLLDISQIEAGKSVLSMQPLNLEKVADQAIIDLEHRSQEDDKQIDIIKEIEPGLPRALPAIRSDCDKSLIICWITHTSTTNLVERSPYECTR